MSFDEEPSFDSASEKRIKYLQFYGNEWEEGFSGWLPGSRKGVSYAYYEIGVIQIVKNVIFNDNFRS